MNFIIYHSGFEVGKKEGPYDPANATRGVDTLIKSVETNGIGRNANVYAELGTTWRYVMRDPTTAAHLLGKLFKHIGEDNVLWGTEHSGTARRRTKSRPSEAFKSRRR